VLAVFLKLKANYLCISFEKSMFLYTSECIAQTNLDAQGSK